MLTYNILTFHTNLFIIMEDVEWPLEFTFIYYTLVAKSMSIYIYVCVRLLRVVLTYTCV